jgi:glucoamylase
MAYADVLTKSGKTDDIKEYLWTGDDGKYNGGAIKFDLEWVVSNWEQNGCDLWEEIQSNDFFWNRFMFRASMHIGAKFAKTMGDSDAAARYSAAAAKLDDAIKPHYNGQFVYETQSRQKDAAVFEAFNHGYLGDGVMGPTSQEVAGTVQTFVDLFCSQYAINGADTAAGVPGVLIGRYDGDHYAGGNPWHLLTASLGQLLYRGATESMKVHLGLSNNTSIQGEDSWRTMLAVPQEVNAAALAEAMAGAGDGVMTRLKKHVSGSNNNLHCSEQLDRNTGVPLSAKDLTWSYANVLTAINARKEYKSMWR